MSEESFDDLMQREWAPVLAVATALVGRGGVAEELTQEAFFAAHRRWDHVGTLDRPGAWVRRVVINRSVSHLRRRRIELRVMGVIGRTGSLVDDDGIAPSPAIDDALWNEVRRLPARQAQCVVLRHVDGLRAKEIAELLGCSTATVRVHLHRGLHTLRSRVDRFGAPALEAT
ncbi:MAG: SigE family RNA polymerase sigma factor [Actinomycetota bacterium]|nr:SigE family RNA polymerase sigma factor [Actinomycetota bacterium]